MKKGVADHRKRINELKGERNKVESSINLSRLSLRKIKQDLRAHEQARVVIRKVAQMTQEQLQVHISDITTLALSAVFDEPYELCAEFVERRNHMECDLFFKRDGLPIDPMTASGGGAVDVAAFALRIASWTMQYHKSRNVIILDEPMRFLSVDLQERASIMIKEISDKLGIQFIIVTHEEALTEYADKIFKVNIKKGISNVTEL